MGTSDSPSSAVDELADTFAEVARTLQAELSLQATLEKIVELAPKTIDGCAHAGVMLVKGGKMLTPAASDDVPAQVDAIQYETGEGPCLDAIRDHDVFQTDDLSHETRWPKFSRRAAEETGVASMLAFRLFIQENTMGALNLFSKEAAAFDAEDRAVGSIFAAHAAVALSAANQADQLEQGMESRDVIGQAKGILMARQHITADEAFDMLRRGSQRLNIKLRDLATQVATENAPPLGRPQPSD